MTQLTSLVYISGEVILEGFLKCKLTPVLLTVTQLYI